MNANNHHPAPLTILFEAIKRKQRYFVVSNKTLFEIEHGYLYNNVVHAPIKKEFEALLVGNGLEVKRVDDKYSIIKKVI